MDVATITSTKQYLEFIKRDIRERTEFLTDLFKGQNGEDKLKDIIDVWKNCKIPTEKEIEEFYKTHYNDKVRIYLHP